MASYVAPADRLARSVNPDAAPAIAGFPAEVPIERLNAEHAHYANWKGAWTRYSDFYMGGEVLRKRAAEYLTKRQKEPAEVFMERVSRVTYENYLGSIIDWYAATLFRRDPQIKLPDDDFYGEFLDDCDRTGTCFVEYLRQAFIGALIYGCHWMLVDFPRIDSDAAPIQSRADEDRSGKSRAYLVGYTPLDMLDWDRNEAGNLQWGKIKTGRTFRPGPLAKTEIIRDTWTIFSQEAFVQYAAERASDEKEPTKARRVAGPGPHALSHKSRLPLAKIEVPEGLWLANRAGLLAMEHFQKSNGLAWALHMGLFAMPIVFSDSEFHQTFGEAYYLQLRSGDRFEWTEPDCKVHDIAHKNLDRLKDEIYRVCYLMQHAGERTSRNVAQSGESKRQDYRAVEEVLKAYGKMVKDGATTLLANVVEARGDDPEEVSVQGLDSFDIRDISVILQDAGLVNSMTRSSPTCLRETAVKVALAFHSDAPKETKDQITQEIRTAPISILHEAALPPPNVRVIENQTAEAAQAAAQTEGRETPKAGEPPAEGELNDAGR